MLCESSAQQGFERPGLCSIELVLVDSYKWLPRSLAEVLRQWPVEPQSAWTRLEQPLVNSCVGLVTTAGLYVHGEDPPFDLERERRNPYWGDPSFRVIPRETPRDRLRMSHLHVNDAPILDDPNVVLPLGRLEEAADAGLIGSVAPEHFSLMGFQLDTSAWEAESVPEVARRFCDAGVDAALLTPG